MTFREKLADWISAGALSEAQGALSEALNLKEFWVHSWSEAQDEADEYKRVILNIGRVTRDVKNGTGQKVYRMASKALGK